MGKLKRFISQYLSLIICLLVIVGLYLFLNCKKIGGETQVEESAMGSFPIENVQQVFPEAVSLERGSKDDLWIVFDSDENQIGYVIDGRQYCKGVVGYAGEVPVLIGLDKDSRVVGVSLLDHMETRSFIRFIDREGFLDSWSGKSIDEALAAEVDSISGATFSSEAIILGVRNTLGSVQGVELQSVKTPFFELKDYVATGVLFFAVASFLLPKRLAKYRLMLLVCNVAVLGGWCVSLVSLAVVSGWLRGGFNIAQAGIVAIIAVLSVVLAVVTGRNFYCGFVCPFGCAQELAGKLGRKNFSVPVRIRKVLGLSKYVLLGGAIFILLFGIEFDLTNIEPFAAFGFESASWIVRILAVVFLIAAVFYPRLWCRFFCPTGLMMNLLRRKKQSKKD